MIKPNFQQTVVTFFLKVLKIVQKASTTSNDYVLLGSSSVLTMHIQAKVRVHGSVCV